MFGSIKDINSDQGYFYPVFIFNPLSKYKDCWTTLCSQNMLTLGYELNEKLLWKGSFTSRTKKAHTVIHCNPSPQRIAGLCTPLKGDAAVSNAVNISIVLMLPLALVLCL